MTSSTESKTSPPRSNAKLFAATAVLGIPALLGVMLISDFWRFSDKNALFIVVGSFSGALLILFTFRPRRLDGELVHKIIDVVWILSSLATFLIGSWFISIAEMRSDEAHWRSDLKAAQYDLQSNLIYLRYKYCSGDAAFEKNSQNFCQNAYTIQQFTKQTLSELNAGREVSRYRDAISPLRLYANPTYPEWGMIESLITWSDKYAEGYNYSRSNASRGDDAQKVRSIWIWLFPAIAALRLSRSIGGLLEALAALANGRPLRSGTS